MAWVRRYLQGVALPGWLLLSVPFVKRVYDALDAWSNLDFLTGQREHLVEWISSPWLTIALIVAGFGWLYWTGRRTPATGISMPPAAMSPVPDHSTPPLSIK